MTASEIIETLGLIPHPEGGYFRETYRSQETIPGNHLPERFTADRSIATSIYYFLIDEDFTGFHRLKSEETWHHYIGEPIHLYIIDPEGNLIMRVLGPDLLSGQEPQITIPATNWFSAHVAGRQGYSLVGCTVAPGFDYSDYEEAIRKNLISKYPQHQDTINQLTKF